MSELKRKIVKGVQRVTMPKKWQSFPQVIQIDTNNHCGPTFCGIKCVYCYPQWKIADEKRRYTTMPTEYIELILRQIAKYGKSEMDLVDFFLNGDGFTEPRLPDLNHYSKVMLPDSKTQTFTNGIKWQNYEAALPLDSVCFTISAHTPELYKTVHGGDHFADALKGLSLVVDNRRPGQTVEVHCVLNKYNFLYAKQWWGFFGREYPEVTRVISPLVGSYDNQPSTDSAEGLTLEDMEGEVIHVAGETGRMWTRDLIPDEKPCVLWDNMSVDVEGWVLQCCNWAPPKESSYGNVFTMEREGVTLKDMWLRRLENRMNNRLCESCNMKSSDCGKRMDAMKVGG
jgi:MoaA/NifB/PqqE/SkfB family radical SAM enzyme